MKYQVFVDANSGGAVGLIPLFDSWGSAADVARRQFNMHTNQESEELKNEYYDEETGVSVFVREKVG